ncbi:putative disease resistance RPP13-like protein 1 [Argentina anserina]|uniref:putative disease resistance RPP13-like protein 1 n=1 Tax=Argentina anserina TaxID=57926 RepID=UPI002176899E|nr:putative disease resistance RPP13-like protein 1 [Potentilla anserina]
MAVGEIFLAAFLQVLFDRLASRDFLIFARQKGIGRKLERWSETLSAIRAVLYDAEEKQLLSMSVKDWLDDLKDLTYDVEDILDRFSTDMLRCKANMEQNQAATSKVLCFFTKVKVNFNMNSEMEKISERLEEISRRKNMLGLNNSGAGSSVASHRRISSCLLDGPVVGRYEDKRKILELLARDEPTTVNFHVVAIVGMPGVGKTTLAKLVFKDNDIALEQFDLKVWVSVSDDFDLVRVTKAILESVTSVYCDFKEFNKVQDNLSKELASKKFLIVLDDVWNTCEHDQWTTLQSPFHVGAPGSKIIVTTRDEKVARMTRPIEIHYLKYMSDDDCWEVFQQHAFLNGNSERPPSFDLFRQSIVRKCGGLPLAARTLGGLLGCEDIDEWKEILNNRLWSLSDKSHIHQVLKLSYHYLPSCLKRCFAYCSILPNDYEFGEKQLILLWMAEGLLQQQQEHQTLEELGTHYFGQLLSRSLFQKSSRNSSLYVMHHLVGDMARWAAGEICLRLEDKVDGRCSPKTRHSSYVPSQYDGVYKFEAFSEAKRLRTFLPLRLSEDFCNYVTCKVTLDLLPKLEYLRVLSLNGYQITELPNSIGHLKHLRYLDLSYTLLMSLPESISTLCNLQTLILESCSRLKTLPIKMQYLSNLRHLNNFDVPSLEGMPPQLSQLSNLQTLPNFVVGKGSDSRIREIGPLSSLRGTLCLSRLENVNDVEDARRTNLSSKEGIDALQLEWNGKAENEALVLNVLKPHKKLKEVIIKGYGGLQFSAWIADPLFSYVVLVRLENCNCQFFPSLGQLPSLQTLHIRNMSEIEKVGLEFCGEGRSYFPLLETLVFEDMQNWKEWFLGQGYQGLGVFPSLKILSVKRCPKLNGELPHHLELLRKLEIQECNELVVSVANYKQLCELNVRDCKGVVYKSEHHFELLRSIYLSDFSVLMFQTGGFMTGLRKVEQLMLANGDELSSEWENEGLLLQHLIALRSLFIERNSHLDQLHCLPSPQMLHICRCPSLVYIPESCLPPSLKDMKVERCSSLTSFARYKIPPSLRTIEIKHCQCLKHLVEDEQASSSAPSLEYLSISNCPSLISLSSKSPLPKVLKHLYIRDCEQLQTICEGFYDDTCLEELHIGRCANLKTLPEGLCLLANLRNLIVFSCESIVSFPRGGLPTRASNLTVLVISDCQRWRAFPKDMINLNFLQELVIGSCGGLEYILGEGFPPNLTSLILLNPRNCTPLRDWGLHLHRLSSLTELCIQGVDQDLVSFPPEEMLLPASLIKLTIGFFPNLRRISSQGLQVLTCLESLRIDDCPKLASIPEDLPLSLTQLYIYDDCPLLKKRYKPDAPRYWAKISHIPYIEIGDYCKP